MAQALLEELPPPQRLALAYSPRAARTSTLAVFALDARLGAVLRRRGEPVLAQMRFAWWRDMLARDPAQWPRGDEVLHLLAGWRDPAALIPLVDGWEGLLGDTLGLTAIEGFARGRAAASEQLAAELGAEGADIERCARWWALGDLASNLSDAHERDAVRAAATGLGACATLPRQLRPLAMLAALGKRSLARGGTPLLDSFAAALLAMRVGIFGR
jgi:phytoene synthase